VEPRNPFKPTFGSNPPILAGRADLIAEFGESLDDGPGSPGRATFYTGARGTGKTVMLNEAVEQARQRGWLVINEATREGLLQRLSAVHLPRLLRELQDDGRPRRRLSGINTPVGVGVNWETTEPAPLAGDLYTQVAAVTDLLAPRGTGLLITLDEVHRRASADLREIFQTLQLAIREDREVAFAAAGLPSAVDDLLNDDVLTFLRRAERHDLGAVHPQDTEAALLLPIRDSGRDIEPAALARAVEATAGYPFLIQLTGYQIWKQNRQHRVITVADALTGIGAAGTRLGRLVHEPALREASTADRRVPRAMSLDNGPSRVAELAARLGETSSWINTYRTRLIAAALVRPAGHGLVDFAMPFMREYLRHNSRLN
jgi:hypothetical protein